MSAMPERILVVKLADLGDALLATPAIRGLRRRFPEARIEVLTAPAGAEILRLCPDVDEVIVFDKRAFDSPSGLLRPRGAAGLARLGLRLRRRNYARVVLLHHLTSRFGAAKYRALCLASGAPIRAGLDNGRGDFLTHRTLDYGYGGRSELAYGLAVIATLGAEPEDPAPALAVPEAARQEAHALLRAEGVAGPYLVIHPSVGSYAPVRNWSPARLGQVAARLATETGLPIVVVGAAEARATADVAEREVRGVDLVGRTSVPQLAALLEGAALVIGSDSGVQHLAAAAGAPVLTIFGPSNQDAWLPYDSVIWQPGQPLPESRRVVVRAGIPCSPCLYTGYALGRRDGCGRPTCLALVTVEMVTQIARTILSLQTPCPARN